VDGVLIPNERFIMAFDRGPVFDRDGSEIVAGTRIRIPAGTEIGGTFAGAAKVAKRDYEVTVDRADPGWPATSPHRYDQGREDQVVWAGSGGYWHSCSADAVEVVELARVG
jgi:hypothetical protein